MTDLDDARHAAGGALQPLLVLGELGHLIGRSIPLDTNEIQMAASWLSMVDGSSFWPPSTQTAGGPRSEK